MTAALTPADFVDPSSLTDDQRWACDEVEKLARAELRTAAEVRLIRRDCGLVAVCFHPPRLTGNRICPTYTGDPRATVRDALGDIIVSLVLGPDRLEGDVTPSAPTEAA